MIVYSLLAMSVCNYTQVEILNKYIANRNLENDFDL